MTDIDFLEFGNLDVVYNMEKLPDSLGLTGRNNRTDIGVIKEVKYMEVMKRGCGS